MHNSANAHKLGDPVKLLADLDQLDLARAFANALRNTENILASDLNEAALQRVPAFKTSANPAIVPNLQSHNAEIAAAFRQMFEDSKSPDLAFVRKHAWLQADHRFPLEALLQSYRTGQSVMLRHLLNALSPAAGSTDHARGLPGEITTTFCEMVSAAATSEYVAHTRNLAEAEGDLRTELLNILLSGYDESDGRVAHLLRQAGYLEQRLSYCIVVAQSAIPSEMEGDARAQRLITAVSNCLADTTIRKLAGLRDNLATFILTDRRRQSGWTPAATPLATRLHDLLLVLGPAVRIGVSGDHPSSAFIRRAWDEAKTALNFSSPERRVVAFSQLSVRSLLLHCGMPGMPATPPSWHEALAEADSRVSGSLAMTLRAIADADLNVQEAARTLGKHPNTLYARLVRIQELTGLDGRHFHDLNELLLAADCWRR